MSMPSPLPATRDIFSQNLRILIESNGSVAKASRDLGINRAQLNRYLNGESHPRPDALQQICQFFGTDARILVTPLAELLSTRPDLMTHPEVAEFTAADVRTVDELMLPSGFYRCTRNSFLYAGKFVLSLLYVYRKDGWCFIKGVEARQAIHDQGLPDDYRTRQYRGYVIPTDGGASAMISRRGAMTCTFNFFSPVASLDRNFWQGYAIRTEVEMAGSARVSRLALEHLGSNTSEILKTARASGIRDKSDLHVFHLKLLKPGSSFS